MGCAEAGSNFAKLATICEVASVLLPRSTALAAIFFRKPDCGQRKGSYSWLHQLARKPKIVMISEGCFARCTARSAKLAELAVQERNTFWDGTLSVHVLRRSMRKTRIARN